MKLPILFGLEKDDADFLNEINTADISLSVNEIESEENLISSEINMKFDLENKYKSFIKIYKR